MRCSATRRPPASHTAAVILMPSSSAFAKAPRRMRLLSSRLRLIAPSRCRGGRSARCARLYRRRPSAEAAELVGLEAQAELRVGEGEGDRQVGVALALGTVHRLHREAPEIKADEIERIEAWLRDHDLQFVAAGDDESGAGFRADADPVDAVGRG